MTLHDSQDQAVEDIVQDIKTGQKWDMAEEVNYMKRAMYWKDIAGATLAGRVVLGMKKCTFSNKASLFLKR